ncbi:DUF4249 family protein [Algoriphagus terrigena]|uniref:DUF4249 family protein n=1 Tax=Algoriphagus terrigena TaxID=344884 RepID=UPI00041C6FBC|nr:DUF4249 family protein [Algoriphagus terrigena]
MKKTAIWLVIFSLTLIACVDEIYLDIPAADSNLVIDAWLGPSTGQSYVKVYRSAPFLSDAINPEYTNVVVDRIFVEDESGLKTYFWNVPDTAFIYRAQEVREFQSGEKYRLTVITREKEEYQSAWVTMPEPSVVEEMEIDPQEKPLIVYSSNVPMTINAVVADLKLRISNPSAEEVGFYIETDGISEVFATSDSENCTCNCYRPVPGMFGGMNLASSEYQQDNISSVKVGELNVTSLGRFYSNSKVKTVPKENLEYLRLIDKQQRSTGSIFDPAPFKIKGNIKSLTNPEQEVMGNFMVFQETIFSQMLYRAEIFRLNPNLSFSFEPIPHVDSNCNTYYTDTLLPIPEPFKP